ncbi:terminase small subunit [Apilactobacillus xinyiensis]|uniref:terminase small subunit n=1 Tax=Apilactobacillus xinyiensis TaxID=2841032 RepID=UPI00200DEBCB|nr:terminase small subunit [Apilactobacillus xinyiensis]MCL0330599.1 terminase small subunit [Apilactobacillus xinyiensis]
MAKINEKRKRFILEYAKTTNGTQAAINAGYSPKNAKVQAARLLANPKVQEEIKGLTESLHSSKVADVQEILEFLSSTMRNNKKVKNKKGEDTNRPEVFMEDRIKSAELLGKHYVMWTDKQEVNGTIQAVKIVDDLEDEADG